MKRLMITLTLLLSTLTACGGGGGGATAEAPDRTVDPLPSDRRSFNLKMTFDNLPGPIGGFLISISLPAGVEPVMESNVPVVTFHGLPDGLNTAAYAPPSGSEPGRLTVARAVAEPFTAGDIATAVLSVPMGSVLPDVGAFGIVQSEAYEVVGSSITPVPNPQLQLTVLP